MFIIVGLCLTIMIADSVLVVPVYLKGKSMRKSLKILPAIFDLLPVRQIKRETTYIAGEQCLDVV